MEHHETTIAQLEALLAKTRTREKRLPLLNSLAYELRETDLPRAVHIAEEALQLSQSLLSLNISKHLQQQYALQQAKALFTLCFCLRHGNRIDEAERYGLQAIELYLLHNDPEGAANTQHILAYLYMQRHDYEKSLSFYNQSLHIFEQLHHEHGVTRALHGKGSILWRVQRYEEAMECLFESKEIARRNSWEKELASILVSIGNLYEDRSKFAEAVECYQESISIFRRLETNLRSLAAALVGMGGITKILGDYTQAIAFAKEAASLFAQGKIPIGQASSLELLSGIYFEQGNYEEAIGCCREIIHLLENTKHLRILAGAWNNLASVYASQNNFNQSVEHFRKALDIYTQAQDLRGMCFVPSNMAEQYASMGRWKEARENVLLALHRAEQHGFIDLAIEITPVFGRIAIAERNFEEALIRCNATLERCIQLQHRRGISLLSALGGDIHKEQGSFNLALPLYEQAVAVAEEVGDKTFAASICQSISQVYEAIGNTSAAMHWFKEYHHREKEVFNENSDKRVRNLQALHQTETAEKERDIFRLQSQQLQKENEFKAKELSAMALHLVQKNEMLESLRLRSKAIVESYTEKSRNLAEEMVQQIESNIRDDNSWTSFNQQFSQLHSDFVHTLSERYPNLTPMELKICSLLKIQLSTKEIAAALVLSPRTVEDHRNRMRKKFDLKKDENLATFLAAL